MRSIWRSVLTWLLVLAMPVQGIAAVGMQHCAPRHERIHPPATVVQGLHQHAHDHAPAMAGKTAGNELRVSETAHSVVSTGHAISAVDFKCSACAACCPALGLPTLALDLPALPDGSSLAPLAMTVAPSFVPSGLDRPPRSVLG
jgi:hypothetical protein